MMRFYYAPNSCSTAAHMVLEEAGAPYVAQEVDFSSGEQHTPEFRALNPKGKVPVLLDGTETITENLAIQYHLATRFPEAGLRPSDPIAVVHWLSVMAWLSNTVQPDARHITRPENYTADPSCKPAVVAKGRETTTRLMGDIDRMLSEGPWIMGRQYTTADPYALVFVGVAKRYGLDLSPNRHMANWTERMVERPAIRKVLEAEHNALLAEA